MSIDRPLDAISASLVAPPEVGPDPPAQSFPTRGCGEQPSLLQVREERDIAVAAAARFLVYYYGPHVAMIGRRPRCVHVVLDDPSQLRMVLADDPEALTDGSLAPPTQAIMTIFLRPPLSSGSPKRTAVEAFARLAGIWFLALSGLYAFYMWTVFMGLREETTTAGRLVMVAGPITFGLSLLVAPAVFAAARDRFDLSVCHTSGTRALQWLVLVTFALATYVLAAFGPTIAVSLLAEPQATPSEPAPAVLGSRLEAARFLLPVAIGLFTVVSGCAGGLIGHVHERMATPQARHRTLVRVPGSGGFLSAPAPHCDKLHSEPRFLGGLDHNGSSVSCRPS